MKKRLKKFFQQFVLYEVFTAIFFPDDDVRHARKKPFKWLFCVVVLLIIGVAQFVLWLITIIPTLINRWVMRWFEW